MIRIKNEFREKLVKLHAWKAWNKEMMNLMEHYPLADVVKKIDYINKAETFFEFIQDSFEWGQSLKGYIFWDYLSRDTLPIVKQEKVTKFNISLVNKDRHWKSDERYEEGHTLEEARESLRIEKIICEMEGYTTLAQTPDMLEMTDGHQTIIYTIVEIV